MSQSINRIQKRAKEIRKELWGAPIFFTLGVLVAEFAFSKIGDNFMYDIQTESLGKLPVYLLLGAFAGGLYMTVRFVAEKNRTRVTVKDIVSHSDGIRFLYLVLVLLSSVVFIPLVIYRFHQLIQLRDKEYEEMR